MRKFGPVVVLILILAANCLDVYKRQDVVAGNTDHALDVALRSVSRIAEDDDVAALDRLPTIHELVDEDALLVLEAGHHAGAFHLHRLVEKDNNERGDSEGDQ